MAKVSTNISIDAETKTAAQQLFAELGMDLSTAINIFLRQSVIERGIPFRIRREPSDATAAALRELPEMEAHPERYKRYSSFDELLREVASDA